jgi:hypothetical protein
MLIALQRENIVVSVSMNAADYVGRNKGDDFYYYSQPQLLAVKPGPVSPNGGEIHGGTLVRFYFTSDFPDRIRTEFAKDRAWDGTHAPRPCVRKRTVRTEVDSKHATHAHRLCRSL